MARIRTIKPEFFKHGRLFDAELESGLPLRLAFIGIWCQVDKRGRFKWRPRELKSEIMPYDEGVIFLKVLEALEAGGFIARYTVGEEVYGWIPSWERHQRPHKKERDSTFPAPPGYVSLWDQEDEEEQAERDARDLKQRKGESRAVWQARVDEVTERAKARAAARNGAQKKRAAAYPVQTGAGTGQDREETGAQPGSSRVKARAKPGAARVKTGKSRGKGEQEGKKEGEGEQGKEGKGARGNGAGGRSGREKREGAAMPREEEARPGAGEEGARRQAPGEEGRGEGTARSAEEEEAGKKESGPGAGSGARAGVEDLVRAWGGACRALEVGFLVPPEIARPEVTPQLREGLERTVRSVTAARLGIVSPEDWREVFERLLFACFPVRGKGMPELTAERTGLHWVAENEVNLIKLQALARATEGKGTERTERTERARVESGMMQGVSA